MHGMKLGWGFGLVLVACGGGSPMEAQTDSNGATESQGETTQGTAPTTSGDSQSGSTGSNSGVSESLTGETGVTETTVDPTMTGSSDPTMTSTTVTTVSTQDTGETSADDTGGSTADLSAGDTGTGTGETGDPGTTTADDTTSGGESTTEPDCIPAQEVCNDLDDDCNNKIDDVDEGMDGVCDCLSIAIVGNEGANPSSEFQVYLQDLGTTTDRINSNVLNDINVQLTPAVLAKYDILILDWLQRDYAADAADIKAWIEAGGGMMTMTGHTNNNTVIDRPNSILGTMGLTYNGSQGFFSGPVTNFAAHPITAGLTSLTFLGGLYIDQVNDGIGVNQTIMTLPQGPVGIVQERLDGRLFVFGDEWVEFDSQWQNMPDIKQFWVQTLAYLGPKDSCAVPQ